MKTGNKQTFKSLIDEISCLYKERESILIPFVISSIPTKIMEAFVEYPDYFTHSSIACFNDGKRDLVLNINYKFPMKVHQLTVSVPPGIFDEYKRIDLLIDDKRKLVTELKRYGQLASSC